MDKSYFSPRVFPKTCRLPSQKAFQDWAFRLDRVLGNGDNLLQLEEIQHFLRLYQTVPGLKKLTYWKSVAEAMDRWGDQNGRATMGDFYSLAKSCGGDSFPTSSQSVKTFPVSFDPHKTHLEEPLLENLWNRARSNWTVKEWAAFYPNAKIRGRGVTLQQLSETQLNGISLGEARIDRHGDLDVTHLRSELLNQWAPALILRKNDDHPTSLQFFAKHSRLKLTVGKIPKPYREALHSLSTGKDSPLGETLFLNLEDPRVVRSLESHPDLAPLFFSVPQKIAGPRKDSLDRSRIRTVLALDFEGSELWFDEKRISAVEKNQREAIPAFHASVKVNPSHLDRLILIYTPLYTRSNRPQGTKSRGDVSIPARGYYHQGDSESVYIILDAGGGLQEILGDTHYYLSRASGEEIWRNRGKKNVTFSVSFLAHGTQLARENTVEEEVRTGSLRARSRGYFYDLFPGFSEVRSGKSVRLKPKVLPDIEGLTQIHTQVGKTIGYHSLGFNDGIRIRRLRTDRWVYNTDPLFEHIERERKGLLDRSFRLGFNYLYGSGNSHQLGFSWMMPFPKMEGLILFGGLGGLVQYYPDERIADFSFHMEGSVGYGFGNYFPHATFGVNAPTLSYLSPDIFGLSAGLEGLLFPISFRFNRGLIRIGGGVQVNVPRLTRSGSFQLGKTQWLEGLLSFGGQLDF